jgi:hypothetical protein
MGAHAIGKPGNSAERAAKASADQAIGPLYRTFEEAAP